MSIISTAANYGGKIEDNKQDVKQFYISPTSLAVWIYKKISGGSVVLTPADQKKNILINSDIILNGSLYNSSDMNLKVNISNIEPVKMEELFELNPIHFNYKNDENSILHYGFLAQDVEKNFPELVGTNDLGYKSVNYQEFIPLLFAKIKICKKK